MKEVAPPHTGLTPSELAELCMLFPKWNLLITVDGYPVPVGDVLNIQSDIGDKRLKCPSPRLPAMPSPPHPEHTGACPLGHFTCVQPSRVSPAGTPGPRSALLSLRDGCGQGCLFPAWLPLGGDRELAAALCPGARLLSLDSRTVSWLYPAARGVATGPWVLPHPSPISLNPGKRPFY